MNIADLRQGKLNHIEDVVNQYLASAVDKLKLTLSTGKVITKPDSTGDVLKETQELAIRALGFYSHEHMEYMIESINKAKSYKEVQLVLNDALLKIGE